MIKKMLSKRGVIFLTVLLGSILCTFLIAATLDDSFDDPYAEQTVSSWNELLEKYISTRDYVHILLPPSPEFGIEAWRNQNVSIQNEKDFYYLFNGGTLFCDTSTDFAKLSNKLPMTVLVYEDQINGQVVVESLPENDKKTSKELITFIAAEWPTQTRDQSIASYYATEISKRRVIWKITLLPESAIPSVDSLQAESLLDTPVPIMMGMMGGGAISEIRVTSIEKVSNGTTIEVSYPLDYTNRLDIFSASGRNGLLDFNWILRATVGISTSTNFITWTDTTTSSNSRFYTASNADLNQYTDSDNDGLTFGYEHFLYHTSPTNSDTDGDGIPDGWEVEHGLDPLSADDAWSDNDNDCYPNIYEFARNSDATNPASVPNPAYTVSSSSGLDAAIASAEASTNDYFVIKLNQGTYGITNLFASTVKHIMLMGNKDNPQSYVLSDMWGTAGAVYAGNGEVFCGITFKNTKIWHKSSSASHDIAMFYDCSFINSDSAAISWNNGEIVLQDCTLTNNIYSTYGYGAGLELSGGGIADISSCIFKGNSGAAISSVDNSILDISDSLISFNSGSFGAVTIQASGAGSTQVKIDSSVISSNMTRGVYIANGYCDNILISNSVISANNGSGIKGVAAETKIVDSKIIGNSEHGIDLFGTTNITQNIEIVTTIIGNNKAIGLRVLHIENIKVINSAISHNTGGGIYQIDGNSDFIGVTVIGNQAVNIAPGFHAVQSDSAKLAGCTFLNNRPLIRNSHAVVEQLSYANSLAITNCIFWDNSIFPNVQLDSYATNNVQYSCIQSKTVILGIGNINTDPLLRFDGSLLPDSPCIDAGTNIAYSITDIHGEIRVAGDNCDIGADEFIDSDSDMLPDWWELSMFANLLHHNGDSDADSFGCFPEMLLGTDPNEETTLVLDYMRERNAKLIWHEYFIAYFHRYSLEKIIANEFVSIANETDISFSTTNSTLVLSNKFDIGETYRITVNGYSDSMFNTLLSSESLVWQQIPPGFYNTSMVSKSNSISYVFSITNDIGWDRIYISSLPDEQSAWYLPDNAQLKLSVWNNGTSDWNSSATITNGPVVLSGRTNLISHIPTGSQKIKIEITGLSNNSECRPLYCRQFCPELEFVTSPPSYLGYNAVNPQYTLTTIKLVPPMDEPLAAYFSNTGTVQYLTFSNNIVNISNETEEVNYMIDGSATLPDDGAITFAAQANGVAGGSGSGGTGSTVGNTAMTLLKATIIEPVYAGRSFEIDLVPNNQQGHLKVTAGANTLYDSNVTASSVTIPSSGSSVGTVTSVWTVANGSATDDAPILDAGNYWTLSIDGTGYIGIGTTNEYTATVEVLGDDLPDPLDGSFLWSISGNTMSFVGGTNTGETVSIISSTNSAGINTLSVTFTPSTSGFSPKSDQLVVRVMTVEFEEDDTQAYGFDNYYDPDMCWKSVEVGNNDTFKEWTTPSFANIQAYFSSINTSKVTVSPAQGSSITPDTITITGIAEGESIIQAHAAASDGVIVGEIGVKCYNLATNSLAIRVVHEENDDIQVYSVGITGLLATAVVVSCGTNGFRDTVPATGDVISADNLSILAGTNGIADTTAKSSNVNSTGINISQVRDYLNNTIYNQAIFKWNVTLLDEMAVNYDLDRDGQFDVADNESKNEQQKIINSCKSGNYNYYIFLVNNPSGPQFGSKYLDSNVHNCAFVHADRAGSLVGLTIAHELGHCLDLPHIGTTNNFMFPTAISCGSEHVNKNQWKKINEKGM